jgi:hypothetical protein
MKKQFSIDKLIIERGAVKIRSGNARTFVTLYATNKTWTKAARKFTA